MSKRKETGVSPITNRIYYGTLDMIGATVGILQQMNLMNF